MISNDPDLERARHQARALLLPTPFATTEPGEEARRAREILAWLGLQPDDQRALHEACTRDAYGVHVPGQKTPAVPGPLHHPLSGQETAVGTPSSAAWDAWVEQTRAALPFENATDLERLWVALDEATCHRGMPGDAKLRDHSWLAHRTTAAALVNARWGGGEAALLFVHYGPVQSFIEAARRTSDLWLGSYLVSDLAFTAVERVAIRCGPHAVVYPHLASLQRYRRSLGGKPETDVDACLRPCVPNRFVAIVPYAEARGIAELLARAVSERWAEMARKVRVALGADVEGFEGFDTQISEHPVVDVVVQRWPSELEPLRSMLTDAGRKLPSQPIANVGEGYADVFDLGRATLGALRRVVPAGPSAGDGRAKCSQCGSREAMGPQPTKQRRHAQREWWSGLRERVDGARGRAPNGEAETEGEFKETVDLRRSEMLCAVCLTKRFAHRYAIAPEFDLEWTRAEDRARLRFPSVASIASAPFRCTLAGDAITRWYQAVEEAHGLLRFSLPGNQVRGLGKLGRGDRRLDPDGTWLYARSYDIDTCVRDHDDPAVDQGALAEALERGRRALAEMSDDKKPSAYYAVVALDVDDMGAWLDGSHPRFPKVDGVKRRVGASLHADVSRRQGVLATERLHEVVEAHLGQLVYSGGDDVLAFLPLHTLWACLAALCGRFRAVDALGREVTLSAGVAIADWKAPLQGVLQTARRAEARAKRDGKDTVAVSVSTRSGMPMSVRLKWGELGALPTAANTRASSKQDERPLELLRPAALETLRAEAPMLQSLEDKAPLRHRVLHLLGEKEETDFAPLQRMLAEDSEDQMRRILDLLALLRFLVREHGGIPYSEVKTEADQ